MGQTSSRQQRMNRKGGSRRGGRLQHGTDNKTVGKIGL